MSTPTPLNNALRTPNTSHSLMLQGSKKTNSFPKNEADSAESMEKNLSPKNASLIHQKRKSPFELEPNISTSRVNKQSSIPLSGLEAVMNLHKLNSTVAKPNTSKTLLDNKSSTQKDSDPYDITAATDIDPALYSTNMMSHHHNIMDSGLAPELRPNPKQTFTVHTGAHHTVNEVQMPGNVTYLMP